eukprot:2984781-Amphidinium_carterae.1
MSANSAAVISNCVVSFVLSAVVAVAALMLQSGSFKLQSRMLWVMLQLQGEIQVVDNVLEKDLWQLFLNT